MSLLKNNYDIYGKRDINSAIKMFEFNNKNKIIKRKILLLETYNNNNDNLLDTSYLSTNYLKRNEYYKRRNKEGRNKEGNKLKRKISDELIFHSLNILTEFFLYLKDEIKDKKFNLSNLLKINFNGFYDFLEFDFSLIVEDINSITTFHYLNIIYLIPEADILKICLINLKNCFFLWIEKNNPNFNGFLYSNCKCHSFI